MKGRRVNCGEDADAVRLKDLPAAGRAEKEWKGGIRESGGGAWSREASSGGEQIGGGGDFVRIGV